MKDHQVGGRRFECGNMEKVTDKEGLGRGWL